MQETRWQHWLAFLETLDDPIVFFDLETTSAQPDKAVILEAAVAMYGPPRMLIGGVPAPNVSPWEAPGRLFTFSTYINPGEQVLSSKHFARSQAIHKIAPEKLREAPAWRETLPTIVDALGGGIVAGHNVIDYDRKVFSRYYRSDYFSGALDTLRLAQKLAEVAPIPAQRTPADCGTVPIELSHGGLASYRFKLEALVDALCDRKLTGAHGALADCIGSADVLASIVCLWPDTLFGSPTHRLSEGRSCLDSLQTFLSHPGEQWSGWDRFLKLESGEWVFQRGKHEGDSIDEAPRDCLDWMLAPGRDFDEGTQRVVKGEIMRRLNRAWNR